LDTAPDWRARRLPQAERRRH